MGDKKALAVGAAAGGISVALMALSKKAKTDEKVTNEALAVLLTLAAESEVKSDAIIMALENLGVEVPMEKKIVLMPFAHDLNPLQGVTLEEPAPFNGYIKQVGIHWPDGCNALVDVRVGYVVKQFCPNDGYLALNDATPSYSFNEYVKKGAPIWVEMRNGDAVNNHAITVTILLEGVF